MNILYVTGDIKWPMTNGTAIRHWNIIQGLRKVGNVDIVACAGEQGAVHAESYRGCGDVYCIAPEVVQETPAQLRRRKSNARRAVDILSKKFPHDFTLGDVTVARAKFGEIVRRKRYALIWVEGLRFGISLDVEGAAQGAVTVLDADDFSWQRDLSVLWHTARYGAKIFDYADVLKTRFWEMRCGQYYSYVVRCSQDDATRQGGTNVWVIPNGTDVPVVVRRRPTVSALFVGQLGYPPNRLGVEWFIMRMWPKIVSAVQGARFDVVGMNPSKEILAANGRAGIRVHGFVQDLREFYEQATMSVVPLQAGGGTRLKILESIGRAVPVVSTSVGAYGIPLTESQGLIRRDDESAFAHACIELLANCGDKLQEAASAGRKTVMQDYNWQRIQTLVAEHVSKVFKSA